MMHRAMPVHAGVVLNDERYRSLGLVGQPPRATSKEPKQEVQPVNTTTTNTTYLIPEAVAMLKAGQKERAHTLLAHATRQAPDNQAAWLWLSAATSDPHERRRCLEQVLAIDATSAMGKKAQHLLGKIDTPLTPLERQQAVVKRAHRLLDEGLAAMATSEEDEGEDEDREELSLSNRVHFQAAVRAFEKALALRPANKALVAEITRLHTQACQYLGQKATTPVDLTWRIIQNRERGIACLKASDYEHAIHYLHLTLKDFPDDEETRCWLTRAEELRDRFVPPDPDEPWLRWDTTRVMVITLPLFVVAAFVGVFVLM
jgi:tetratricopeptide (TPR) repeat protein